MDLTCFLHKASCVCLSGGILKTFLVLLQTLTSLTDLVSLFSQCVTAVPACPETRARALYKTEGSRTAGVEEQQKEFSPSPGTGSSPCNQRRLTDTGPSPGCRNCPSQGREPTVSPLWLTSATEVKSSILGSGKGKHVYLRLKPCSNAPDGSQ
jgi:hypothetical protein